MPTTPQTSPAVDPFAPVHALVADVLRSMGDLTTSRTHDALEQELLISSREFARRAVQGHLDARAAKERRDKTASRELLAALAGRCPADKRELCKL